MRDARSILSVSDYAAHILEAMFLDYCQNPLLVVFVEVCLNAHHANLDLTERETFQDWNFCGLDIQRPEIHGALAELPKKALERLAGHELRAILVDHVHSV